MKTENCLRCLLIFNYIVRSCLVWHMQLSTSVREMVVSMGNTKLFALGLICDFVWYPANVLLKGCFRLNARREM